jgi:serine/threonine protein kinase
MAEIFLATETLASGSTRRVVIKRLLPRADALWKELFERERKALGQIESENVVVLHRSGPDYLLLEHIDGPDLEQLLTHYKKRGQRLPLEAAASLISGLLSGLEDLHSAQDSDGVPLGLVHRDINPSNILISKEGQTKIIDLGVVHTLATRDQTQVGVKGTLAYMAPEQLSAKPVDVRTDLYAAGLVVYEVLTGSPARPPGKVGVAELIKARAALPATPSSVHSALSAEVDEVLLKVLDPDPEGRFVSASDFHKALNDALSVSAKRDVLADMAAKVQTLDLSSGATMGVSLSGSTDVDEAVSTVTEVQVPTRRSMLFLTVLILATVAVALWTVLNQPEEKTRLAFQGTPKAPLSGNSEDVLVRDVRSSRDDVEVPTDVKTTLDTGSIPDPGRTGRREAPARRTTRRPAPSRSTSPAANAPKEVGVGLLFKTVAGSSLYVKGAQIDDGFAPRTSKELTEGANLFQLRGPKGTQAILRVNRSGERLSVRLGAPQGRYFSVQCNGQDRGHTPVMRLAITSVLKCSMKDASGGELAFEIEKVTP